MFAAPGDETRLAAGTIAAAVAAGDDVTVLTCARDAGSGDQVTSAMRVLGVLDHRYLGDADARISGSSPRRYGAGTATRTVTSMDASTAASTDALSAAAAGEVAADIATVISLIDATAVVTDGTRSTPEAIVVADATRHACDVMGVECHEAVTSAISGDVVELDVSPHLDPKRAASAAYGLPSGTGVTAAEWFRPAFRTRSAEWAGLGVGARIAALVVALAGGAAVGALGTVVFQAALVVGAVRVPLGLIAVMVVVAGLLVGLRLVFQSRYVAAAAAVGMIGVITVLSQESPGGSVLIPAFPLSYVWVYGPVLIAAAVLAWPDLARIRRVRIAEAVVETKGTPPQ